MEQSIIPDPKGVIERLAIVICFSGFRDMERQDSDPDSYWHDLPEDTKNRYRAVASRWLKAMREEDLVLMPKVATEHMVHHVAKNPDSAASRRHAARTYRLFVNARPTEGL